MKEKLEELREAISEISTEQEQASRTLLNLSKKVEELERDTQKPGGVFIPGPREKYFVVEAFSEGFFIRVYNEKLYEEPYSREWHRMQTALGLPRFRTEKGARRFRKYLEIKQKVSDIAERFPVSWDNTSEPKYYFRYDHELQRLDPWHRFDEQTPGVIYGRGGEFIEAVKDAVSTEDLIMFCKYIQKVGE
jgi:hypothetical protein